jgi:hypothetical protein
MVDYHSRMGQASTCPGDGGEIVARDICRTGQG